MIATLRWARERCRWLPVIIATLEYSDLMAKLRDLGLSGGTERVFL
jgi:hypothetical protein